MGQSIKPMDIAVLTAKIATMLTAGCHWFKRYNYSLAAMIKPMRVMLANICSEIESGIPPSRALRQYPFVNSMILYCDLGGIR